MEYFTASELITIFRRQRERDLAYIKDGRFTYNLGKNVIAVLPYPHTEFCYKDN